MPVQSPYLNVPIDQRLGVTKALLARHPLKEEEITNVICKSWDDIFNSKIGSFKIGREIFPSPQIISFFLHELTAHYLTLSHKGLFVVGKNKNEKDIHHVKDESLSVEIKASSHPTQIFGNRSYAQPNEVNTRKSKDGYYITINFEKISKENPEPKILAIRFGYLEHTDWIAQLSATGQQARLKTEAYLYKLIRIYPVNQTNEGHY